MVSNVVCSIIAGMVEVLFPYDATLPDELNMKPGDLIEQEGEQKDAKWAKGTRNGKQGLFYKPFTCEPPPVSAPPAKRGDPQGHKATYHNHDYIFLEKPDVWLECTVCQQLADNPHQTPCCGLSVSSASRSGKRETTAALIAGRVRLKPRLMSVERGSSATSRRTAQTTLMAVTGRVT